jgi:hypothetical protein
MRSVNSKEKIQFVWNNILKIIAISTENRNYNAFLFFYLYNAHDNYLLLRVVLGVSLEKLRQVENSSHEKSDPWRPLYMFSQLPFNTYIEDWSNAFLSLLSSDAVKIRTESNSQLLFNEFCKEYSNAFLSLLSSDAEKDTAWKQLTALWKIAKELSRYGSAATWGYLVLMATAFVIWLKITWPSKTS